MLKHPHHQLKSKLRSNSKTHCDLFSTNGHDIQDMPSGPDVPQLHFCSTSNLEKPNSDCLASQHQPTLVPSDATASSPCYNLIPVMATTFNGIEYFPIVSPQDTGMCGTHNFFACNDLLSHARKPLTMSPRDRTRKTLTRYSAAHKVYQSPFRTSSSVSQF